MEGKERSDKEWKLNVPFQVKQNTSGQAGIKTKRKFFTLIYFLFFNFAFFLEVKFSCCGTLA